MAMIEEVVQQFNQLPLEVQLECSSEEFLQALRSLETTYNVPLSAVAVQMAVGHIQFSDLALYIETEYEFDPVKAERLAHDIEEKVFRPAIERLNFLDTSPEKIMTIEQQKNFAENLFRSALLQELNHHPFIIAAINDRLFYLFARDENFHTTLERALYENSEAVGAKPIQVNNEVLSPTIGHWLKDYISQHGTDAADSISQSTFLLNSENAKKLSVDERTLLGKILKIYSNIKFFPNSMPTDDGEGWEIIPGGSDEIEIQSEMNSSVSTTESSENITNNNDQPIKTTTPSHDDTSSQASIPLPRSSTQKVIINKPSGVKNIVQDIKTIISSTKNTKLTDIHQTNNPKISEELLTLKNMLLQYPPDSLERQAIEEEIKTLEAKSH